MLSAIFLMIIIIAPLNIFLYFSLRKKRKGAPLMPKKSQSFIVPVGSTDVLEMITCFANKENLMIVNDDPTNDEKVYSDRDLNINKEFRVVHAKLESNGETLVKVHIKFPVNTQEQIMSKRIVDLVNIIKKDLAQQSEVNNKRINKH